MRSHTHIQTEWFRQFLEDYFHYRMAKSPTNFRGFLSHRHLTYVFNKISSLLDFAMHMGTLSDIMANSFLNITFKFFSIFNISVVFKGLHWIFQVMHITIQSHLFSTLCVCMCVTVCLCVCNACVCV